MKIDSIAREVKRIKDEYTLSGEVALEIYKMGGQGIDCGKNQRASSLLWLF